MFINVSMAQILYLFSPLGKHFFEKSFNIMQLAHKQKRRSVSGVLDEYGAGNETRTRDPDLGKVVLYQLSYSRKWRPLGDSNPCYRRERAVS